MKNLKQLGILATAIITLASCYKNEDEPTPAGTTPPTGATFKGIQEKGLSNRLPALWMMISTFFQDWERKFSTFCISFSSDKSTERQVIFGFSIRS